MCYRQPEQVGCEKREGGYGESFRFRGAGNSSPETGAHHVNVRNRGLEGVNPNPPEEVLVRGQAGLVINKLISGRMNL